MPWLVSGQSLSKMLRQIIAFSLLILSGLSAISGEPVNRSSRFKELTNDCVSDGNNSSTCETHNGINSVVIANNDSVVSEKDGDEFLSLLKNTLVEEGRKTPKYLKSMKNSAPELL